MRPVYTTSMPDDCGPRSWAAFPGTPVQRLHTWLPAGGMRMLSFISLTPGGRSFMYQGWSWISGMVMRLAGSAGEAGHTGGPLSARESGRLRSCNL